MLHSGYTPAGVDREQGYIIVVLRVPRWEYFPASLRSYDGVSRFFLRPGQLLPNEIAHFQDWIRSLQNAFRPDWFPQVEIARSQSAIRSLHDQRTESFAPAGLSRPSFFYLTGLTFLRRGCWETPWHALAQLVFYAGLLYRAGSSVHAQVKQLRLVKLSCQAMQMLQATSYRRKKPLRLLYLRCSLPRRLLSLRLWKLRHPLLRWDLLHSNCKRGICNRDENIPRHEHNRTPARCRCAGGLRSRSVR